MRDITYPGLLVCRILTWVGLLVVHELDKLVVAGADEGAEAWSDPVDPVVALKVSGGDTGSETACWVERCSCVVDT